MRSRTFRLEEPDLLDSALQAQILQRCRRSIDHDLKNAIQALHSGLEVLTRTLQAPGARKMSPLECIPLLQQQLAGLQNQLGLLLDEIAPEPAAPAAFDLSHLLVDLLRFLNHERVVANAQRELPPQAMVLARRTVVRRVLLSCVLDAIDHVEAAGSLHFVMTRDHPNLTLEIRVKTAPAPMSEVLKHILERTMAAENLSIAFADDPDGYSIRMRLPEAARAMPPRELATADVAKGASSRQGALRILIVDDNRDAADSLALLLELEGYDAKSTYTGGQALALVGDYRPAVVLLDIGLPDMSGDAVARKIRESSNHRPLLFSVSGYDVGARRDAAAPFEFDAELVKPVEIPVLRKLLTDLSAQ